MQAPTLRVIAQRTRADCSVACLAMLCGVDYEAALMAFRHNVCAMGASGYQILAAAKRLGKPLSWRGALDDLETETGILQIGALKWPLNHLVMLKEGQVIDTDFTLWDADVFLAAYEAEPIGIFTLKEGR